MSRSRAPILYTEEGERPLPFKFEICEVCEGHGTSSAYLGAFTQRDVEEAGEEFMDDYMAGRFDRPCEHCEGGKVRVADRSRISKEDWTAYVAQEREAAECDEIHRQERLREGGWREEGWFEP